MTILFKKLNLKDFQKHISFLFYISPSRIKIRFPYPRHLSNKLEFQVDQDP